MKQGQKPAEPRMEDVLASIRRAIDENAAVASPGFGGSMAELRVKPDKPPARTDSPTRREDHSASASVRPQPSRGFAGILGGRQSVAGTGFREISGAHEPQPQQPPPAPADEPGHYVYDGYYGAQVANYAEAEPEPYQPAREITPPRYPPPAAVAEPAQDYAPAPGLLSESSSAATQASFNQLAETITRRALGERPIADIAQELLRGMLKEWLDENLPKIVERLVREEIERVVRRPQR